MWSISAPRLISFAFHYAISHCNHSVADTEPWTPAVSQWSKKPNENRVNREAENANSCLGCSEFLTEYRV